MAGAGNAFCEVALFAAGVLGRKVAFFAAGVLGRVFAVELGGALVGGVASVAARLDGGSFEG